MTDTHAANRVTISYSEMKELDCFRKHHFSRTLGLRKRDVGAALTFGRVWDTFMNHWHPEKFQLEAAATDDRFVSALAFASDELERESAHVRDVMRTLPEDFDERVSDMSQLLMSMAHHYRLHHQKADRDWEVIERQVRFELPLRTETGRRSPRFSLVGVIDAVMRHIPSGDLAIWDNKSAASIDGPYRMGVDLDRQMPLYVWASREMGWDVRRVVYDVAAKKIPAFPKMTKGSKNVAPRFYAGWEKSTSLPVAEYAIDNLGIDATDYEAELWMLRQMWDGGIDNPFFWREELLLREQQISEAAEHAIALARVKADMPPAAMPDRMKCGMCSFKTICANPRPDIIADLFTTPDERAAMRAAKLAARTADMTPAPF